MQFFSNYGILATFLEFIKKGWGMLFDNVKLRQNLLLGLSMLVFLAFAFILDSDKNEVQALPENFMQTSIKNLDREIQIHWNFLADNGGVDTVEISIKGEGVNRTEKISADIESYSFTDGEHGKSYEINISAKNGDDVIKNNNHRAVFLDFGKLPDLPIISIKTRNGKIPTFEMAKNPGDVLGQTSINNEILDCEIKMTRNGVKIANSRGKIRVRGNTSVEYVNKPYKLKLNSAADLLELGNAYADKEWALLNQGTSLNTYFVENIGNIFNVEWQPRIRYVNLMLNDEWQGCNILSESVKRSPARVNISSSGFLFEYDPYFWRPNTFFFHTEYAQKFYGYTFKYPNQKNLTKYEINKLRNYLMEFEEYLTAHDDHYMDYIDIDSFATWVIVHDIVGTLDSAGSNMYFYKYDFDLENPTSTKIKRGPLWDFDSAFQAPEDWSAIHHHAVYLNELFKMESFRNAYKDKFYKFKNTVMPTLKEKLGNLSEVQISTLQESWDLHSARWNQTGANVRDDINFRLKFLENKIDWIDKKLKADDWE